MKRLAFALLVLFGITGNGWGLTYTGAISVGAGLYGQASWESGATLSWIVTFIDDQDMSVWKYEYTFTVLERSPSHEIIEVCSGNNGFAATKIIDSTNPSGNSENPELGTYEPGGSNPDMLGNIYGIKWDSSDELLSSTWTLVTGSAPMWGDFYAKGGRTGGVWNVAYNTGFGHDTDALIGNGNAFDAANNWAWVLVPDSEDPLAKQQPVPEPGTVLLFGGGLLGLAVLRRWLTGQQ